MNTTTVYIKFLSNAFYISGSMQAPSINIGWDILVLHVIFRVCVKHLFAGHAHNHKYCQFGDIFVIGCTESCQNDPPPPPHTHTHTHTHTHAANQWRKYRRHYLSVYVPISQIPQCIKQCSTLHHFVTFLLQNGTFWNMGLLRFARLVY